MIVARSQRLARKRIRLVFSQGPLLLASALILSGFGILNLMALDISLPSPMGRGRGGAQRSWLPRHYLSP